LPGRLGRRRGRGSAAGRARGGLLQAGGLALERIHAACLLDVQPSPDGDDRGQGEPYIGPEGREVVVQHLDKGEDQDDRGEDGAEHGVGDRQAKLDARDLGPEPGYERRG
jgi:hypothetical protein